MGIPITVDADDVRTALVVLGAFVGRAGSSARSTELRGRRRSRSEDP